MVAHEILIVILVSLLVASQGLTLCILHRLTRHMKLSRSAFFLLFDHLGMSERDESDLEVVKHG